MGKKSKAKKVTKKERAKHLQYLQELDKAYIAKEDKFDNTTNKKWAELSLLYEEQIQIFAQTKDAHAALNGYLCYWDRLAKLYSCLFRTFMYSQNYSAGIKVCTKLLQFSSKIVNKSLLAPHIDLFLLRLDKTKSDLHSNVILEVAGMINQALENDIDKKFHFSQNLYISMCLFELSRLQMYEAVKHLSHNMLRANRRLERAFPADEGANFYLFSLIDELRFDLVFHGAKKHDLFEIAKLNCIGLLSSKCDPLPFGEAFLGCAILYYYGIFYTRENYTSLEVEGRCIEAMERYLDFKSSIFSSSCCTCQESGEDRLLLCQGCRAVFFCCKDHQRLNFLHHEETGTRGMGHKYLCPVFKSYHKRNKNKDAAKKDHLERKFRRACKRFLMGTLQSVCKKRVKCLVTFETME
ncbi:predicted protein [Chaetoceros tenuissimus]|uniref:MYND-type domain-containing protein n=1 Tax=Chaetoceros tenuissimus TaxID=426638 RepID=A0AAD3D467_9STRA|nr:predicted protein [Chaetoceros tenuissimus]